MPNLVGIGNSQVPTNAMLGGLAYQDSVGEIDIDKIKAKTSDTAVDIFVYDTRKDSDGGAWRKKATTQSWYNEKVSMTRGARKEFPSVAVIVVENGATYEPVITIYDGDDPNLPMWMVFKTRNAAGGNDQRTSVSYYAAGPYPIRKVAMLNGVMVDCQYRSAGHAAGTVKGVTRYNFINDSSTMMTDEGDFKRNGNLGDERNTERSYTKISTTDINHTQCNDVAVTVLPNAPIDASTGLPIITIAVATDGGVNVLKDNGTVVNWTETSGPNSAQLVTFRKDSKLGVFTSGTAGIAGYPQLYYIEIPTANASANYWYNFNSLGIEKYGYNLETNSGVRLLMNTGTGGALSGVVDTDDNTYASTSDGGLGVILPPESVGTTANMTTAAISYVTKDYNTGYMIGDIRGAFLSDTDDTNATELVNNHNFNGGITGWTTLLNGASGGSPGITVVSGKLRFQQGSSNSVWLEAYQDITTVVGKKYLLNIDIASTNTSANWRIYAPSSSKILGYPSYLNQGQHSATFTATSTTTRIRIQQGGSASTVGEVESVSVKLVDDDRSTNDNYLRVFGTIEKHPVASGAELVSYRPNSSSLGDNYFRLPLTSSIFDLTSEWSITFWAKKNGSTAQNYAGWEIAPDDISSNNVYSIIALSMYFDTTGVCGLRGMNGGASQDAPNNPFNAQDFWRCVSVVHRSSPQNTTYLYIDGELVSSRNISYSNPSSAYSLYIFGWSYGSTRYYGRRHIDFSLFRMSESAPSAEQVKKIYHDERHLFQENAKATLYGTSDDINALAVDDSNNVVYAGTSSGRSEFQGLKRINNTTTAVTTAISASNELVAEQ